MAIAQGTIIVGAVAPDADAQGFPIRTAGVIAVDSSGAAHAIERAALRAPGDEILTLEPGGSYDYASGSSLATAHVTGDDRAAAADCAEARRDAQSSPCCVSRFATKAAPSTPVSPSARPPATTIL